MSQNPQNQNPFTFDQTLLQKIDHDILFHARRLYDRMNDKCDMDKDYTCTKCDDGMNSVLSRGQCNCNDFDYQYYSWVYVFSSSSFFFNFPFTLH